MKDLCFCLHITPVLTQAQPASCGLNKKGRGITAGPVPDNNPALLSRSSQVRY
jgi:hypothetical protein